MKPIPSMQWLVAIAALSATCLAHAQVANNTPGNLVIDGSMNFFAAGGSPLGSGGQYYAGADPHTLAGWSYLNPGPTAEYWVAFQNQASPDGGQYLGIQDLDAFAPRNNAGGITQTIAGLVAGAMYQLTFYSMSNHDGVTGQNWNVTFGNATQTGLTTQPNGDESGNWVMSSMLFTATSASQALTFAAHYLPGSVPEMLNLDGVVLERVATAAPVPEPATYALMLAGLGAIRFLKRRKSAA